MRIVTMRIVGIVFVMALVATTMLHVAEAVVIPVGSTSGWSRPSNSDFYSSWAAGLNFTVGDILVFDFVTGGHDVAGVTKDGYDNCNATNPKFLNTTSPFSFTLDKLDDFFFICTVPGHCSAGQKLAITNLQQPPPPTSPNTPPVPGNEPSPPPASPDSPPVSNEMPPPVPVVIAPPPPNSATSIMASIFTVAFVSIAVTFIIY